MRFVMTILGLTLVNISTAFAGAQLEIVPDSANVSVSVANGTNLCGKTCPPIKTTVVSVGRKKSLKIDLLVAPDIGCAIDFEGASSVSVHLSTAPGMG